MNPNPLSRLLANGSCRTATIGINLKFQPQCHSRRFLHTTFFTGGRQQLGSLRTRTPPSSFFHSTYTPSKGLTTLLPPKASSLLQSIPNRLWRATHSFRLYSTRTGGNRGRFYQQPPNQTSEMIFWGFAGLNVTVFFAWQVAVLYNSVRRVSLRVRECVVLK